MRHLKKGRKFGRTRDQRRSMYRTMLGELILCNRITTSHAKARELRPAMEKLITLARQGRLSGRRLLLRRLPEEAVKKLITETGPRMASRSGGYTRIVKLGPRKSDSSQMAIIEFVK